MNTASLIPSGLLVVPTNIIQTPDAAVVFQNLMPTPEAPPSGVAAPVAPPLVASAQTAMLPSVSNPAGTTGNALGTPEIPTTLQMPETREMPEAQTQAIASTLPQLILKSAPKDDLVQPADAAFTLAIPPQVKAIKGASVSPAKADKNIKTETDESADGQCPVAIASLGCAIAENPVATSQLPASRFVELTPARTVAAPRAEIGNAVELRPKPLTSDKLPVWTTPIPMPFELRPSPPTMQPVASTEVLSSGHLDLARDTVWLDQLAREIVAVASDNGTLRFGLSPKALGNLDVAISTQADGVNIHLQPSTENAARIFAAEQPKLAEELRQSGIRLTSNDMMSGNQAGNMRNDSHAQNANRQTSRRVSASPAFAATSHTTTNPPQRGRFA